MKMINKNSVTTKKYEDKNHIQFSFLKSYSHLIRAYGCLILPFDNSLRNLCFINLTKRHNLSKNGGYKINA
jgi:hypothetical protein